MALLVTLVLVEYSIIIEEKKKVEEV